MDHYLRFNRKAVDDRQIDTLIGLCKGLVADGRVDQAEAETLQTWLIQSRQTSNNPIIANLLDKVSTVLADGVLDAEEAADLLEVLQRICGTPSEIGELAKPSTLPLDDPPPPLVIPGRTFLFTGTCVFGARRECQEAVKALGGLVAQNVTRTLDYLVIGSYVTDSWAHESYGRKIEKAMAYRASGSGLVIVSEDYWLSQSGL